MPASASHSARTRIRTLSKSDFKLARTCEAKLYFRENGYPDNGADDPFLQLLAEGGYMVEALAKAKYPEGIQLQYGADPSAGAAATAAALGRGDATLFEATLFQSRRMARVDILQRAGSVLRLIEVKAKSFDRRDHYAELEIGKPGAFRTKKGVSAEWRPYLEDVTYQVLLLEDLFPDLLVKPYLALVDKSAVSEREGVFDLFERLSNAKSLSAPRFLGDLLDLAKLPLVAEVDVSTEVSLLRDEVRAAAERLTGLLDSPLTAFQGNHDHACRDCEFRNASADGPDGFRECWGELADAEPHILELYSIGTVKVAGAPLVRSLYDRRRSSLFDVPLEALARKDGSLGTTAIRQRRQIDHTQSGTVYVSEGVGGTLRSLRYPLHFIDFEACRPALPYHARMRPYGLLAFQWSCHTIAEPGGPPAHTEWLNIEDRWPSAAFVATLRDQLGTNGTILTWSSFEQTTLRDLRAQMDVRRLIDEPLDIWFASLNGRIFDLHSIAEREYYHPKMKGRTSIKVVLDALWHSDPIVRQRFAEWFSVPIVPDTDPYKALPPIEINGRPESVAEGTGAIRAYETMMFSDGADDPSVRTAWAKLLRQYCELDTLAMVLVYDHWLRASEGAMAAP